MSYGPLAFVSGLTLGDYLLWNWSLNYNHDVLALVSGLTLPPLALTFLAMLAMTILRLIGSSTRRSAPGAAVGRPGAEREGDPAGDVPAPTTTVAGGGRTAAPAASGSSRSSSGKLAA